MTKQGSGFLFRIAAVAALGGLLFGFDTAVISGTTPFLQPYFQLSDFALGWTVSSLLIGCIVGVSFSGKPSDLFGRRKTLMAAAFLFVMTSLGSASSTSLWMFIGFRLLGGIAVGIASMLSPMYISEISPGDKRGKLVSLNQLAIVIGIVTAFFTNYLIAGTGENCWRWMLAVMALPALLFAITLFFVPESPRWLMQKGNRKDTYQILEQLNGPEKAQSEILEIEVSLAKEKTSSYHEVFAKKYRYLLWIGILLSVLSQITGINSIMYYAPLIFKSLGNGTDSALTQTIIIGSTNLIFTLVAIRWIDQWGRKPLLIAGSLGMIISLTVVSIAYFFHAMDGIIILIFILLYIASFAASLGPVTWVVVSEIFPNHIRSKAMSLAIVSLWISNFVITLLFPVALNRLGGGFTFLIFDVLCVVMLLFVWTKIPETKGKSLEELESYLVNKANP